MWLKGVRNFSLVIRCVYTFWAISSCILTFFFLHPHNFVNSETGIHMLFEFRIWECAMDSSIREVNHVTFWIRGCSGSKVCINCWFSDCWIRKTNFYCGLVDSEWFFQLWMFCIFLFWINIVIHVLSEAPIQKITGRANPKFYQKRQFENLLDFIIQNTKKKNVHYILRQFYLCATLWGCRKKNVEVQEETV